MEQFSADFQRQYPTEDAAKIEATLRTLNAQKVDSIDIRTISEVAGTPSKLFTLLQVGLRRVIDLSEAGVREMNRQRVVPAIVLVRAVFETSCLMFDAVRQADKAANTGTMQAVVEYDKYLMDAMFGSKSKEWSGGAEAEEYATRNVLTIMQRLAKEMNSELMWFYNGLSEHAHPNYLGMSSIYQVISDTPHDPIVRFSDSSLEARETPMRLALRCLEIGTTIMLLSLQQYIGGRNAIAAVCEKALYEDGTWPAEVTYPVKRD
jgi:hypothetical protein